MAYGSKTKSATQGSAGKAYVQPVRTSGTPSGVKKPGKSTILFGHTRSGIGGGSKGAK